VTVAVVAKVPFAQVHQTWPLVEQYFAAVEPHTKGDYTLDQIRLKLGVNDWALVVAKEGNAIVGALSVVYQNRPNARVAFITCLGGESVTTDENWSQLQNIFKKDGATLVEAAMRPSTFRLWSRLGFEEKYLIAEVKL
jgi:hypothetical protein